MALDVLEVELLLLYDRHYPRGTLNGCTNIASYSTDGSSSLNEHAWTSSLGADIARGTRRTCQVRRPSPVLVVAAVGGTPTAVEAVCNSNPQEKVSEAEAEPPARALSIQANVYFIEYHLIMTTLMCI